LKNTIIVLTSNVGSFRILEVSRRGASSPDSSTPVLENGDHHLYPEMARVVKEELEATMRPELLNRIDEIVVFSPLSPTDLSDIAELLVRKVVGRAESEQNMKLEIDSSVIRRVMQEGSSNAAQFGARPMRRAAQRFVEDSLSDAIIQGFLNPGDAAKILLAETGDSQKDRVIVIRVADGETLEIEIEDGNGGIGSVDSGLNGTSLTVAGTNGGDATSSGLTAVQTAMR
jgi:ATP-dependent Clp protease ATP-binding subunit ClpC